MAQIGALGLCASGRTPEFPQTFEYKLEPYMRDLLAPTVKQDPPPLEETDPALSEIIRYGERLGRKISQHATRRTIP